MKSPSEVVILCNEPERIIGATDSIMPLLPKEAARALNRLKLTILMRHGKQAVYDRFNGRSVADILAAHTPEQESAPIAFGEVDGLRYEMFEKPDSSGGDPDQLDN